MQQALRDSAHMYGMHKEQLLQQDPRLMVHSILCLDSAGPRQLIFQLSVVADVLGPGM